jgi:hypothetical protein
VRELEITLALSPEQLDDDNLLPLGQGHDGTVQPVALVAARRFGARIAVPRAIVHEVG